MIEEKYLNSVLSDIPIGAYHSGFDNPCLSEQRYPGLVLAATKKVPANASQWFLASEDCDGFGCGVERAAILPLSINNAVAEVLKSFVQEEFAGDDGLDYLQMMSVKDQNELKISYIKAVNAAGLTCSNENLERLTQALYPLDASPENLKILTGTEVELNYLDHGIHGICIFVVGQNCD